MVMFKRSDVITRYQQGIGCVVRGQQHQLRRGSVLHGSHICRANDQGTTLRVFHAQKTMGMVAADLGFLCIVLNLDVSGEV